MMETIHIPTISEEYRKQNLALRKDHWGASGWNWSPLVVGLAMQFNITRALDYGCGEGTLAKRVHEFQKNMGMAPINFHEYDPAFPGKDVRPDGTFDLVTCTDVMEHIEPVYLYAVLDEIFAFTERVAFFVISLRTSKVTLPDGRNSHLIVRPPEWWENEMTHNYAWGRVVRVDAGKKSKSLILVCTKGK